MAGALSQFMTVSAVPKEPAPLPGSWADPTPISTASKGEAVDIGQGLQSGFLEIVPSDQKYSTETIQVAPQERTLAGLLSGAKASPVRVAAGAFSFRRLLSIGAEAKGERDRASAQLAVPAGGRVASTVPAAAALATVNGKTPPAAAGLKRPTFTPARFPVWRRGDGAIAGSSGAGGGVQDKTLLVGEYVVTLDGMPAGTFFFEGEAPIRVVEKRCTVKKARLENGELKLQVAILENPIPLLLLVGVAAGAVGLAGFGVSSSLKAVDRIIVDVPPVLAIGAVVVGGYFWLRN